MKKIIITLFAILLTMTSIAAAPKGSIDIQWDDQPIRLSKGGAASTDLLVEIPKGTYLIVDKTDLEFVTLEGVRVIDVKYPRMITIPDPASGGRLEVYPPNGAVEVEMEAPRDLDDGIYMVKAIFHYQACSKTACYNPSRKAVSWNVYVGKVTAEMEGEMGISAESGFDSLLNIIKGKSSGTVLNVKLKWLYLIAFLGGILTSLTPCILPLIPVTMLIIGVHPTKKWGHNLSLSLTLVIGMSITYAAIGLIAGALGLSLSFFFQSRLFVLMLAVFFFLMGLSLMGLYTMQLPSGLRNALTKVGGSGYRGAFLTGISMGLLATPCVGPVLATLLVYAASAGKMSVSFTLLMVYGLGLGLVIVVIGTWYGTMVARLKKARVKWVKRFVGILLIATSLYYLNSFFPFAELFTKRADHPISWETSSSAMMSIDKEDSRHKMVLFTAKWCPPCRFLSFFPLRNPKVVALSKRFKMIKVDMTRGTRLNNFLVRKYNVVGWPTILFVSPEGVPYEDLRIFGGYISARSLLEHMNKALKR